MTKVFKHLETTRPPHSQNGGDPSAGPASWFCYSRSPGRSPVRPLGETTKHDKLHPCS